MLYVNSALAGQHSAGTIDLKNDRICYKTLTRGATITASTEAEGFPASALSNGYTYEYWRPTALPATVEVAASTDANYCGISSHNLGSIGATIDIDGYDGAAWVTITTITPTDDDPILALFDTRSFQKYRLNIADGPTVMPSIAVWFVGLAMAMPVGIRVGHSPMMFSRKFITKTLHSHAGGFVGRTARAVGFEGDVEWKLLDEEFYRAEFNQFVISAMRYPFFWAFLPEPDIGNAPNTIRGSAIYAQTRGGSKVSPKSSECTDYDVKMSLEGFASG